ncbi:MAG TPA: lipid A biosynthesis acyltransferase, partial [Anaeromyxobacteraceae bacterium]|nr:lipid A biosynthesis acyltransferase [Anaeromyxobacteraceae bacterium]
MAVPLRKRLKRWVRAQVLRALALPISALPLGPALALGAFVGRAAFLLAGRERARMLEHLAIAFPEKSLEERRALARASLVHLGQVAMEIATLRRNARDLERYVSLAPGAEEVVRRAHARGRGLVFVAGHIGNWELLALRLARIVQPGAVVARHTSQPWLDRAMQRARAEFGFETLWREDPGTARGLLRLFRRGGGLGILIDQDTRVEGVYAPFFGRL